MKQNQCVSININIVQNICLYIYIAEYQKMYVWYLQILTPFFMVVNRVVHRLVRLKSHTLTWQSLSHLLQVKAVG